MIDIDLCWELAELLDWKHIREEDGWLIGMDPKGNWTKVPDFVNNAGVAGWLMMKSYDFKLRPCLTAAPNLSYYECHFEPIGYDGRHVYGFPPETPPNDINEYLRRRTFSHSVANAFYIALSVQRGIVPHLTPYVQIDEADGR